jgi:hypothetical protein
MRQLYSYIIKRGFVQLPKAGVRTRSGIPARRKRSEAQRTAIKEAAAQLDALLVAEGVTEDELVARWHAAKRRW